ncbi:MAG TPA: COX15/CtaA family protein [Acidimicrobiales bacterium]|nr:COX15/CtaA family protein [Acidimicrobiales bacterium]
MRLPAISATQYRRITTVALVLVCAIVVTGAAVRLTNSGLGCVDWPNCTRNHFVASASFHPQVEQLNRDFTGLISVAVAIAVLGALARVPRRRDLILWSLGLVAGLVGDIVLGGIVVLSDLWPPFVMAHFLLSAAIVWDAVVLHDRAGHADVKGTLVVATRVRDLGRALVGVAAVVLLTGTIVTGTGPHAGDQHVKRLPFLLEDVARIHSLCVWVFLALTVVTLVTLARTDAPRAVLRRATELCALIVAQGAIGYAQYFLGVPAGLVLLHIAGALAVWVVALRFQLGLYAHPAEIGEPLVPIAS